MTLLNHWMQLLHTNAPMACMVGFGLIFFISFVPVLPIPAVAAVLGTVCPIWLAFVTSWGSAAAAAILKYYILRYILRSHAETYLSKLDKVKPFLRFMEHNGFLAVLTARIIPFVPSAVINVTASVTKVRDRDFVIATLLGKIPIMFTFVLAGSTLKRSPWMSAIVVCVYGLLIAVLWVKFRALTREGPTG